MIVIKRIYLIAIFFLFIGASAEKTFYTLSKGSAITIHGISNLHSWSEKAELFSGSGSMNFNSDGSLDIEEMNIQIDVRSIKSDKGTVMNNNTYKALKGSIYPQILFGLHSPVKSILLTGNSQIITVKGNLSIAGVTRVIDMKLKVTMLEHGKLSFDCAQPIKMTDYGIKPPTALLGTLKTGNEIIIHLETLFEMKAN